MDLLKLFFYTILSALSKCSQNSKTASVGYAHVECTKQEVYILKQMVQCHLTRAYIWMQNTRPATFPRSIWSNSKDSEIHACDFSWARTLHFFWASEGQRAVLSSNYCVDKLAARR